jgi:hypothetical protein
MTLPRLALVSAVLAAGFLAGLVAVPQEAPAQTSSPKQVVAPAADTHQVADRRKKGAIPKSRDLTPAANEDFTYTLKNIVRTRSSEFCERYGADGSCIEEIEICLTMRDRDDDVVRICMNTAPDEEGDAKPRVSGLRQRQR